MIQGIIGKKIGMTRIFVENEDVPVTVIETGGCVVQKKSKGKEGYEAMQLGFGEKESKRTSLPMKGHFKKANTACFYHLREFKGSNLDEYKVGQALHPADVFKVGDYVDVRGRSKGKGFMGVMKRWHFSGGGGSHGSMHNRAPGSIGSSSYPSRVFKGMRMAGHMGSRNQTIENLKIVGIRENIMLVRGAIPGHVNAIVEIRKAAKKG